MEAGPVETPSLDKSRLGDALALCRVHPSAFIEFTSGLRQGAIHNEVQEIWSKYADSYAEFPRGHGKSVQGIFRCAWEIGNNPNILIKVIGNIDDEAVKYVEAVRDVLESERYRMVFPEIEKDTRNWGKSFLRVKRTDISKDPTIEAAGIMGNPGGRFDLAIFDDIFTLKNSVQSAVTREAVKEQYKNTWMNMRKKNSRVWRVGTPWHINDGSAEWRRNARIHTVRYPCHGTHKSPWSEHWTGPMLEEMKELIGDIAYARAYLLQPITGNELVFDPELMKKYAYPVKQLPKGGEVVCAIDMAYRVEHQPQKTRKSDPDYSVIGLALQMPDGHTFPFRLWRGRVIFPVFKQMLMDLCKRHKVKRVITEEVAAQIEINRQIGEALPPGTSLIPLTRTKDKYLRAIEVQNVLERGEWHLPKDEDNEITAEFRPMYEESCDFPFGEYDDTVDVQIDLMRDAMRRSGRDRGVIYKGKSGPVNVFSFDDILRVSEKAETEREEKDRKRLAESGGSDAGYWG